MSNVKYYNYKGYGDTAARDFWYGQAVRIGDRIECSGQGGWDPITAEITQPIDVPGQIEQAFRTVEIALKAAGGTGWDQVYKVRSYHVALTDETVELMVANLRKFCGDNTPLWTMLGIDRLGRDDMKVEIEVSAYTGPKQT